MKNVTVTNKGEETFVGKFDGKEYVFEPEKPLTVNAVVAGFLFGYGMDDAARARVLVRNGWQRNGMADDEFGPKAAMKRLRSFVFKSAPDDAPRARPKPIELPNPALATKSINVPGRSAPLAPPAGPAA